MKFTGWLAVVANLLAQGWAILVLLGTGKVIGNAVLIADGDAYTLIALEFIAGIFTLALALQLLVWKPKRQPLVQAIPSRQSAGDSGPRKLCNACRKENLMSAKNCAWCGSRLK